MGFGLLHQAMLDTVIVARDKYLRPGGLILPDKATLWLCGLEDIQYREEKLDYWNDVYGFDMSCVREKARGEPLIDVAPYEAICTKDCQVLSLDMYTCTKEQLEFEVPFRLIVSRNDYLTAWVIFFDVGFTGISPPRWFSTSPRTHPTHWCQAIFYLGEQLVVCKNEVSASIPLSFPRSEFLVVIGRVLTVCSLRS
jgi:protein arginine N-methyltransferase 1